VASLYIKDAKTAALVSETARRAGKTKTAVVREAVEAFSHLLPSEAPSQDFVDWYMDFRERHPLPPLTGLNADKAFYDSLYDDDDEQ
jgi:antitoxin VapB